MIDFGQCGEPSCNESSVRLFDCAHHCMRMVCLQHLIEHDRLIEHNQQYLNNLRSELAQLWTTYSSLVDETKLYSEFEQKLKKHQQIIRDVINLLENNSINNTEQHRCVLEILKQNIEQLNHNSTESCHHIEEIKSEPFDKISNSMDVEILTHIESNAMEQHTTEPIILDSATTIEYDHQIDDSYESIGNETMNDQTNNNLPFRKLTGKCPLWFDGAFGLTQRFHGLYICSHEKSQQVLFNHLIQFHKLKLSSVEIICQAIQNNENPIEKNLFQLNDIVIDQRNHFKCPFSTNNKFSLIKKNSSVRPCRTMKPQFLFKLRYHLVHFHNLTTLNANKLISKLQENNETLSCN